MSFFLNNPFIRILSFWLLGLLFGFYAPELRIAVVCILGLALLLTLSKIKSKASPFDFFASSFLAIAIVVLASFSIRTPQLPKQNREHRYVAQVLDSPTPKPNSYQCLIRIEQADSSYLLNRQVLAYFEKTEAVTKLKPGDRLAVNSQLQRIQNSGEPFAFNYRRFMANRQVFFSTYIPSTNYSPLTTSPTFSLKLQAEVFRGKLIRLLHEHIDNQEVVQVISALTLGYRKELAPETRSYFASTGAMHVLAVSGLHVGMIFLFLSQLLGFLKRSRLGQVCFVLLIAALLWAYALLTGFSPSVQRATVMFSFILIGNSMRRPSSIYNSIAASAFLLLLINPRLIFEVGFQLSYAAVTSIVFFYPRLERLIQPKNKLLIKAWQLFCVSFAAQLGTFALSIYYFHQFPVFFWLSNFIVLPAAYLILGGTLLFFLSIPLGMLSSAIAWALAGVTQLTLFALKQIDQLPYSLIANISISNSQLTFLIGMLISLAFFIKLKRKAFLFATLSFYLIFLTAGLWQKQQLFQQRACIVYARHQAIQLINGRNNYLLLLTRTPSKQPPVQAVIRELQLNQPVTLYLDTCISFQSSDLVINQGTIVFINQTFQYKERIDKQPITNDFLEKGGHTYWSLLLHTKLDSAGQKGTMLNNYQRGRQQTFTIDL